MKKLPIECRARLNEVKRRALELAGQFSTGNRNDTAKELISMEKKTALAVLANMMNMASEEGRESLCRYFTETA